MARPRHPLALLLLLPGLLAAAGADDAQAAYEPTSLATHVLRDCALDLPTAACCAPVLASVDLGGGVPYLLHVAARPEVALAGLNASHLIAVYDVCGGLGNGGAQLAARRLRDVHLADRRVGDARALYNDESGTPTSPLTGPVSQKGSRCHAGELSSRLIQDCDYQLGNQSEGCCRVIFAIVDQEDCLCYVSEQADFISGELTIPFIWTSYEECGGRRRAVPKDTSSCHPVPPSPPPSPPPPAPASPPPPPSRPSQPPPPQVEGLSRGAMAGIVAGAVLITVTAVVTVGVIITKKIMLILKAREPAPLPSALPSQSLEVESEGLSQEFEQVTDPNHKDGDPVAHARVQIPDERRVWCPPREPRSLVEIVGSTPAGIVVH